jgi:uncharacterized protein (TIGR04255 family)
VALGKDEWPIFEPQTQNIVTVTLSPAGTQQVVQTQSGWLLAAADRRTAITLLPSLVLMQTQDYRRYSASLADPLRRALAVFTEVTGASVVARLGLRYVNRLTDPAATTPQFWADHIRPVFAGPLAGPLGRLVDSQHQQVQFRLDPTAAARVQCGVYRDPDPVERHSFLVDLDVFREQALEFDPELCADLVRQLNRTAVALFSEVLSEKYLADLGPVVIEEVDH